MASLNKVLLIGNLGKDPEIRNLENGSMVATFSIATTEGYKDKSGNWHDQTEWHNIVAWRNLAEVAEKFLKKGSSVYVQGRLRTRTWEDKDGKKHYQTEVIADEITALTRTPGASANGNGQPVSAVADTKLGGDLPF
jgi:single-strand DNA-binding protein